MQTVVGVEPVDEAPIGLYTKLRKTRTFEMDVMQKSFLTLHVWYIYGCLYQYH